MTTSSRSSTQTPAPWFVYILECAKDRLYTGITLDLERRFYQHQQGRGAMFTRLNKPQRMLGATLCENRSEASQLEARIKKLSVLQKRQLVKTWRLYYSLPQSVSQERPPKS